MDVPGNDLVRLLGGVVLALRDDIRTAAERIRRPVGPRRPARGKRTVGRERHVHLLADGDQLPFVLAVEGVVVILHGDKWRKSVVPRGELHVVKLVAVHGGCAQRAHLARPDKPVQRRHRLLDGRGGVKAVDDIQVEVVRAQPF